MTPDDEDALWEFLTGLSIDSRRPRFFGVATSLRAQAHLRAAGDDTDHHGVIAIVPGRGTVGHAAYVRVPNSERAEVAVVLADDLHHLGLATLLLIRLAQFGEDPEISRFFAELRQRRHDDDQHPGVPTRSRRWVSMFVTSLRSSTIPPSAWLSIPTLQRGSSRSNAGMASLDWLGFDVLDAPVVANAALERVHSKAHVEEIRRLCGGRRGSDRRGHVRR